MIYTVKFSVSRATLTARAHAIAEAATQRAIDFARAQGDASPIVSKHIEPAALTGPSDPVIYVAVVKTAQGDG